MLLGGQVKTEQKSIRGYSGGSYAALYPADSYAAWKEGDNRYPEGSYVAWKEGQ